MKKQRMITGVSLDVKSDSFGVTTLDANNLEHFYSILNCDCIDIVTRKVGGKWFDIVCDDEGLLKGNPIVSAIDNLGYPMFCGNLLVFNHEGDELASLTDDDCEHVMKLIQKMYSKKDPEGHLMLTQVEYR